MIKKRQVFTFFYINSVLMYNICLNLLFLLINKTVDRILDYFKGFIRQGPIQLLSEGGTIRLLPSTGHPRPSQVLRLVVRLRCQH